MAQWQKVFFIAAGIYILCATFYNIFGSGERQPWDNQLMDEPELTQTNPIHTNGNVQPAVQLNGNGTLMHETRQ